VTFCWPLPRCRFNAYNKVAKVLESLLAWAKFSPRPSKVCSGNVTNTRNHKSLRRRPLTRRWWIFGSSAISSDLDARQQIAYRTIVPIAATRCANAPIVQCLRDGSVCGRACGLYLPHDSRTVPCAFF